MFYKYIQYSIICCMLFFCCSCGMYQIKQTGMIQDLTTYPQNVSVYADMLPFPLNPILSKNKAEEEYESYKKNFFAPWKASEAHLSADEAYFIFDSEVPPTEKWWAENLLNWTDKNWNALIVNAAKSTFPSRFDRGILVERVSVRAAPTQSPIFLNPTLAGEGFPFDYFIMSNLHMGMPVNILHTSNDGAWLYIETDLVSGWIPEEYVALVTPETIEQVINSPQVSIIHDKVKLQNNNTFVGLGFLGTVLPLIKEESLAYVVLAPTREQNGTAKMVHVEVLKSDSVLMPEVLTAKKMATIANPLIEQVYGWGGEFGHRDCSEFLKDLFIPFGVWLPRNSAAQVHAWNFIPIEDKSELSVNMLLKEKGIPFATSIGFKGHIGLYLGMYNDKPVMIHDIWGLRTNMTGFNGRHLLGRVVITSLTPGSELPYVPKDYLLNKLIGISVLP